MSFCVFGLGALFLGCIVFPLIHLFAHPRIEAQRRCRYIVHIAFRAFLRVMTGLGVIEWRVSHADRLMHHGQLVAPNHPSLIDVVVTIAQIPDAYCLVKASHWRNPFLFGVMRATGYVSNADGVDTVARCAELLQRGETLVLFPEGTRSVPGQPLKLQRGALAIALKAGVKVTPVIIRVTPGILEKGRSWCDVPPVRPRFELEVHPPMELGAPRGGVERFSARARLAARELGDYYERHLGVEYGQSG